MCIRDRSSIDLSTDPCFPEVRSQGSQGSCSAWATTYYSNGFLQAKDNNWIEASIGNNDQLLNPGFTYNKCNYGYDHGSHTWTNGDVMSSVGVCRWSQMPYDQHDCVKWGNENAWRDAPLYRINNSYFLFPEYNDEDIDIIKNAVGTSLPVIFAFDADSYSHFGSDDVLGSTAMEFDINHANTIVGFDDNKMDLETGEIGAFKVVNSWGSNWGPTSNGYYWLTYEAFKGSWNQYWVCWFDDLYKTSDSTSPSLLGVWEFDPTPDRDSAIEMAIGEYGSPLDIRRPIWDGHSSVMHPYPTFMCLDITEFLDEWGSGIYEFHLSIGPTTGNDGTITSFKLEFYNGSYVSGEPDNVSHESKDIPKDTPSYVTLVFNLNGPKFKAISITGGIGVNVVIKNTGGEDASDVDWHIIVKGGIFSMVDEDVNDSITELKVDTDTKVTTGSMGLYHFGFIEITVTTEAADTKKFTDPATGIIIGPFVYVYK